MKKLAQLMLILGFLGLSANAQEQKRDDSRYLAGAVPEVDGRVVFTKEFSIPGMSRQEVFDRVQQWMETRLEKNENNSRVVYTNEEKGQIVGTGKEWIVFTSNALSLDRTEVSYQLTATCKAEQCTLEVEKIRFSYREGKEKYTAEEWVSDKIALNKSKTKLVRGFAKWRRKTVDFADDLAQDLAAALSATPADALARAEAEARKKVMDGPIVISTQPKTAGQSVTPVPAQPIPANDGYREVAPDELTSDLIQTGNGKLVIVVGKDEAVTANAGGSLGKMSGKAVVFCFLAPDQPYESVEQAGEYTVRFYPTGAESPTVVMECKKLPSQVPLEGQPRMYIGEILKASVR